MDLVKALTKGVDIAYKPILEYPAPDDVSFVRWLMPGMAVIRGSRLRDADKFGLCCAEKGLLTEVIYKSVEPTDSGLIRLTDKHGAVSLLTPEGVRLSAPEADDARDLGEGMYAQKRKKLWAIFRAADGAQLTDYAFTDLSSFSEGTCAAETRAGVLLLGADCRPLFPGAFERAWPFKEGFARVGDKKEISYIDRSGRTVFAGAGRGSRDFCNGYAVITDKSGRMGAINTAGQVVVPPRYKFMKDAEGDRFVVSNTGSFLANGSFSGRDYGLIDAAGREILPLCYGRVERQPSGNFRFGSMAEWLINEGNRTVHFGVLVFGLADPEGRLLLPRKFVSVGEESEGLCAFKSFEDKTLRMGYMRPDGTPVFEVATVDYGVDPDSGYRNLLREDMDAQLRPFKGGRARVSVKNVEKKVGVFKKTAILSGDSVSWYEVDSAGREIRPEGPETPVPTPESVAADRSLPFHNTLQSFYASPFMNAGLRPATVKLTSFEDMYEVSFTFGFAILDKNLNCLCGHDDGLPSQPFQFIYLPHGQRDPYKGLVRVADNLWQIIGTEGQKLVISEFESPIRFSCGCAPFRTLTDKKFLWGFMDCRGNQLTEPRYTEVSAFQDNYAFAKTDSKSFILYREPIVTERP